MQKIRYSKKVECVVCGYYGKPKEVWVEFLKPMRSSEPDMQFAVRGKCGHYFKMSAKEMDSESLYFKREPLWLKIRRVMTE